MVPGLGDEGNGSGPFRLAGEGPPGATGTGTKPTGEDLEVTRIDPYAFYTAEELAQVLFGRVSLEVLRRHGLKGLQEGYYGQNVHDALVRYLGSGVQHSGPSASDGEGRGYDDNQRQMGHLRPARGVDLQGPRVRSKQSRSKFYTPQNRNDPVESFRDTFDRLQKERAVQRKGP